MDMITNEHTRFWDDAHCRLTGNHCSFKPTAFDCTRCNVPILTAIEDLAKLIVHISPNVELIE